MTEGDGAVRRGAGREWGPSRLLCLVGRHRRSSARRFRDGDGLHRSVCRRCGVPMLRRPGTGRWVAYHDRDRRRRTRPIRRLLDRLTGPVLFLLVVALLLGVTLWLRGAPPVPGR